MIKHQKVSKYYETDCSYKILFKPIIVISWTKFGGKRYFQSKTKKMSTTIGFYIFKLV